MVGLPGGGIVKACGSGVPRSGSPVVSVATRAFATVLAVVRPGGWTCRSPDFSVVVSDGAGCVRSQGETADGGPVHRS
jgi:hypothetical protein